MAAPGFPPARCGRIVRLQKRCAAPPRAAKTARRSSACSRSPGPRAICSLTGVWLQLQVEQVSAQHHDRAVAAVVPGVGKLEGISARDFQLPILAAREPEPRKRHRLIEELQLVALA